MYLAFRERFELPARRIFPYFESPARWAKLYGVAAPTTVLKDDWHAVPLAKFPFPLKARNVECIPGKRVRWIFGGFWRGVGEVNLDEVGETTVVDGFEYITPHGLWLAAPLFERYVMKREFERIWALGWERIRKGTG